MDMHGRVNVNPQKVDQQNLAKATIKGQLVPSSRRRATLALLSFR